MYDWPNREAGVADSDLIPSGMQCSPLFFAMSRFKAELGQVSHEADSPRRANDIQLLRMRPRVDNGFRPV